MKEVQISDLVAEGTTQARHYDDGLVDRYADCMKDGAVFPPVIAFSAGNGLYLADGFHRRGAALKIGRTKIEVDVRKPLDGETPQRSAILYAVGANDEHGQNRTPSDKRHAVEMLLRDPEWSKWTDREIARQCRVGAPFVGTQRTRLINAGTLKKADKRTAKRGGKEYEIDTAKIGKPKVEKPSKPKATAEQKKIGSQVRESLKAKSESSWTKQDERDSSDLLDMLAAFCKRYNAASRPAQIHVRDVVLKTIKELA